MRTLSLFSTRIGLGAVLQAMMNKGRSIGSSIRGGSVTAESLLDAYLDSLDRQLHGLVPDEDRFNYVNDAAFWIEGLVNDLILEGEDPVKAMKHTIAEHGSARFVADRYIQRHFEEEVDSPLVNRFGRGNVIAVGLFGIVNLVCLILIQLRVFFPNRQPINLRLSPAELRLIIPDPLPIPEMTPVFYISVGCMLLSPLIAGVLLGIRVPVQSANAAYYSMGLVLISSFVLGMFLLPNVEGLIFALIQIVWWLPVGMLSAALASSFARRFRQRKNQSGGGS